jgi:hypothetical protein
LGACDDGGFACVFEKFVAELFDGVLGLIAGTDGFRMWVGTVVAMVE